MVWMMPVECLLVICEYALTRPSYRQDQPSYVIIFPSLTLLRSVMSELTDFQDMLAKGGADDSGTDLNFNL